MTRPAPRPVASFLSLLLSYLLAVSLFAPFTLKRAVATPKAKNKNSSEKHAAPAAVALSDKLKGGRRDNELIVRFREGSSEQERDALVSGKGVKRAKRLRGQSRLEKLETQAGQDMDALVAELRQNQMVELVEPNYLISKDEVTPNDPRFAEQWALKNTGVMGGQPGADISAGPAWETTTGTMTTVIAVIDSGIDFKHPDLRNNQWANRSERENGRDDDRNGLTDDLNGWDWITNSGDVRDEQGHGTIVAGIIASQGNNGVGISGVMWRAGLMSLRVLDNAGTGDIADAIEAIDYAVEHGAQVVNCSWGTDEESLALKDAMERASRAGVVVVSSAGNSGRDIESAPYYPASYGLPGQIAVASTDNFDRLTSWSSYGGTHITIAAPGTDILTTKMGGGYTTVTGTSASTPLVAGVVGLIKTQRWWLSAAGTRVAIVSGARQVAELTGKVSSGGVVSASGALSALQGPNRNGNGGNGNNGNGSGANNGGGNGSENRPSIQPPPPGFGSGGTGPGGSFAVAARPITQGTPNGKLPNLDQVSRLQNTVTKAPAPISSNLPCTDCDPAGDGGGGYEPPNDARYSTARTFPANETGHDGVDLGSRNFNWGIPILGLPGRAGLDLGLTLTYNSLVWTRQDAGIKYNADRGFPGPGFRLGFPTIQQRYYNSQVGVWAYMMVTPSGGRVELRQVGASNIYESQDSSYTEMTDYGNATALVRTADGTRLSFVTYNGEMRCTEIKDRNGNYITVTYNGYGHATTATDTLGRVVNFNYDGDQNLTSITQSWGGTAHTWATFYYGQVYIQPNFPGLYVNGPNYAYQTVLTRVAIGDGSYYDFSYNTWGQVYQIARYAADSHLLSYTWYNLPTDSSAAQSDCPRFTEQRRWAEEWNLQNNVATAASTFYSAAGDGSWSQMTTPDGTVHKVFFATIGWQRGLPILTEVWVGGVKKKWTETLWTQDDTMLPYRKNPRPYDISTYDEVNNRRHIDIIYTSYGLPGEVREYSTDGSGFGGFMRRTYMGYRFDQAYIDRHIIGLVNDIHVVDENNNFVTKITFDYDRGGEYLAGTSQPTTQHDDMNYGTGLVYGRGNQTDVWRWDVTDIVNPAKAIRQSHTGYDTNGSVIFTRDALNHQTTVSYTDLFSDNVNRNTFAYPTAITDADSYTSTAKYNYDFGAVTRTQDPKGAVQRKEYDGAGRIEKVTTELGANANYGHTRFVYQSNNIYIQSFTKVSDSGTEAYNLQVLDGFGQVRATAGYHPGSAGGYLARIFRRDAMNRVVQVSNPTEITGVWAPYGEDAAGWIWTHQAYDWNGRPTVTTFPSTDGGQTSHTVEASYGGCGCAGGDVTTIRDERGRRRKLTKDVVGRLKKVEELNWDQSVYSTTNYTYNARDQITNTNQAGQTRSFVYDGHGRLWKRTTPEQGETTYAYFSDDTVQTITDARGATSNFGYNYRHLPTSITYGVTAGVAATPNVSFGYDEVGNRTSMTDWLGSVTYHYDQLSRMDWEERTFSGLGTYRLTYGYSPAGQLTSVTNPWNVQVSYNYDSAGRVNSVLGANYGGVSSYIGNISYRAFGGVKEINYGNARQLSVQYDKRLRMTRWDIPSISFGYQYYYHYFNENSHRVTFASQIYDHTLDRSYDYGQGGQMWGAHTGAEARGHAGIAPWGPPDGPYAQNYAFDVWGNITWRNGWGAQNSQYNYGPGFVNNKMTVNPVTGAAVQYDDAGNLTNDGQQSYTYDATGQQATAYNPATGYSLSQGYDGDGVRVRKAEAVPPNYTTTVTTYYLRSSVLGKQVVAELSNQYGSWQWARGYVYLGGQLVAIQDGTVKWVHQDPITKSQRLTDSAGAVVSWVELDPWGGETGRSSNQTSQPHRYTSYERDGNSGDEAMMRRYESKWQRFAQPDPYDGSYALNDPQSFNRYSYVQNDPVNFVDPSGLCMLVPLDMGEGGIRLIPVLCNDGWLPYPGEQPSETGGGGSGPQEVPRQEIDDCMRFAAEVEKIAKEIFEDNSRNPSINSFPHNMNAFMDRLARRFTELPSGSGLGLAHTWIEGTRENTEFGSGGFKPEFQDPDPTSGNQVRHATFGLIIGYAGDPLLRDPLQTANNRENRETDSGRIDIALNNVTVPMGINLRGRLGVDFAKNLADWIRKNLCTPRK
jgi:RHS repeat-associated protein